VCLEVVRLLQALAENTVVVNLAIDRQRHGLLVVDKRLSARIDTDDTKAFVNEDGIVRDPVATPIGAPMSDSLAHFQGSRLEFLHIGVPIAGENAAHGEPK